MRFSDDETIFWESEYFDLPGIYSLPPLNVFRLLNYIFLPCLDGFLWYFFTGDDGRFNFMSS